jgi:hypothetical protein
VKRWLCEMLCSPEHTMVVRAASWFEARQLYVLGRPDSSPGLDLAAGGSWHPETDRVVLQRNVRVTELSPLNKVARETCAGVRYAPAHGEQEKGKQQGSEVQGEGVEVGEGR